MKCKIYYYERLNFYICYDTFFIDQLKKGFEEEGFEVELLDKHEFSRQPHIAKLAPAANGNANHTGLKRCVIFEIGSKYYIINHHDRHYSYLDIKEPMLNDENCGAVFQCQYREAPHHKILPFTYLEQDRNKYAEYKANLEWKPQSKVLHFRANIHGRDGRRKRRHVIPMLEDIITPCLTNIGERPAMASVDMKTFMTELSESHLALCVPGNGNLCHRELECFGLGVPVLMPKLINSFYDPLIPDYHYVSVDCNWERDSDAVISEAIRKKYHETVDNIDILKKVSKNAKAWHTKNVDNFFYIIKKFTI